MPSSSHIPGIQGPAWAGTISLPPSSPSTLLTNVHPSQIEMLAISSPQSAWVQLPPPLSWAPVSTKSPNPPPWNNCPSSRLMLCPESYPARNIYRCPDPQNFRMWPYLEIGALQMWLKLKWWSTAGDWAMIQCDQCHQKALWRWRAGERNLQAKGHQQLLQTPGSQKEASTDSTTDFRGQGFLLDPSSTLFAFWSLWLYFTYLYFVCRSFLISPPSIWRGEICASLCFRQHWHPTPVLLPGKSHGRRSLVGSSPWGR